VEARLRSRDVSALPPNLQFARTTMLDNLKAYYLRGVFPRNYVHSRHRPSFIDRDDRVCAVAHLMIESGQERLARQIAVEANDAYVRDINVKEFDVWAAQSGLTKEELAFIQPSYHCTFHPDQFPYLLYHVNGLLTGLLNILYLAASIGVVSWLLNGLALIRRQRSSLAIGLGLAAGITLIVVGLLQFQTIQAQSATIHNLLDIKNGLTGQAVGGWRPCLQGATWNGSFLNQLRGVLPQNPEAFRNLLLILGTVTLLVAAAAVVIRRKVIASEGALK
jgi:hypothetical protein